MRHRRSSVSHFVTLLHFLRKTTIQSSWNVRLFAFVQFIHSYHSFVHHIRHSFVTHRVHATVSVGWSVHLSVLKMGTSALRQYPRMVIDHIVCIFTFASNEVLRRIWCEQQAHGLTNLCYFIRYLCSL